MSEILTSQKLIEQKKAGGTMSTAETLAAETCIRMQIAGERGYMSTPALAPAKPRFDEPGFKLDAWQAEGKELARRKKELITGTWQLQFDVGDWLIRCENYRAGEGLTGYSKSTLRTFVYVARHVPVSMRNATLAWGIQQLVAPFKSDGDKELFLRSAAKHGWSVSIARARLTKEQANGHFKSSVEPKGGSDYKSQNIADMWVERGHDKDEMEASVSRQRLQRAIDRMRQWKFHPIDDEDLSRAVPLLHSDDKAHVIRMLRKGAQELLNMAERMEAVGSVHPSQHSPTVD
jgi:hypothetical protein